MSGHVRDESLHLNSNAGSPTMTRLQPRRDEEISVPPHERIGLHNRQERAPVDEMREQDECDSRGVVRATRSDLPLDIAGELLPEE